MNAPITTLDIETSILTDQAQRVNAFLSRLNVAVEEAKAAYEANKSRPSSEWFDAYWTGLSDALEFAEDAFGEMK